MRRVQEEVFLGSMSPRVRKNGWISVTTSLTGVRGDGLIEKVKLLGVVDTCSYNLIKGPNFFRLFVFKKF